MRKHVPMVVIVLALLAANLWAFARALDLGL